MRQSPFNPITPRLIAPYYASPFINGLQKFPVIFVSSGLTSLCGLAVDFGNSYVGYSQTQQVILRNDGTDPLTVYTIAISGGPDGFSVVPPELPLVLDPETAITLEILLNPEEIGVASASLVITSDSISSPVCSIDLSSTATAGSPNLSITSDTYLGNFGWCGYFPYTNTYRVPVGAELSDSSYVPYYFRRKSWEGEMIQNEYNPFVDLSNPFAQKDGQVRHFVGTGGAGAIVVDDTNCSVSGELLMSNEIGFPNGPSRICAGSSFAYYSGKIPYTGSSTSGLYELLNNNYSYWSEVILAGDRKTFFASPSITVTPLAGTQYRGSPCGQAILGVGSASEVVSDPMPLANSARNGGAVQIADSYRSAITAYSQSAKTMSGEASALHLTSHSPSVAGTILATLYFTKTPTGGGSPEEISIEIEQVVGIGGLMDITVFVPMLTGYTIVLASSTVLDVIELMDDFLSQAPGHVFIADDAGYTQARRWAESSPRFDSAITDPTIYCFANWDSEVTSEGIVNDTSGGYWPGYAVFSALDGQAAYDNFDDRLDTGVITSLSRGLGWAGPGVLLKLQYDEFREDWDGMVAGSGLPLPQHPSLGVGGVLVAISFHWWEFLGVFQSPNFGPQLDPTQYTAFLIVEYVFTYDEFESYSAGPVTSLANGTGWASAGYFA